MKTKAKKSKRQQAAKPQRIPISKLNVNGTSGRPSDQEMETRVLECAEMLCKGLRKSHIKRIMSSRYGVGYRATERCLAKARATLLAESGKRREQLIAESYAFYCSVLTNSDATVYDRIRARERIDILLGLDAPRQISGGPLVQQNLSIMADKEKLDIKFDFDAFSRLCQGVMSGLPDGATKALPASTASSKPTPQTDPVVEVEQVGSPSGVEVGDGFIIVGRT